jgi:uncharacterized FlaG/YvyC family protein
MVKQDFNWEQEQAWDEYKLTTKAYENAITHLNKLHKELKEMLTLDYNKKLEQIIPLVKDRICEELELSGLKASEELRELQPIEKEDY